jgi:GPH family glycoside/pentoside/hexuronide:cation symporter
MSDAVTAREKIGYGLGDTASNLFWQTFMLFLLYFYTDVYGIPAAVAGTMFLVTRIWDAVNDPIMGVIADRTNSKWGKFRPYLLWMAVPFGIIGVLTFTTPDLSLSGKIIYAYITYTFMMMVYTAINIPYSALMGVVSPDPLQRTSFSQYRFVFAFIGGLIVQGLALPLVNGFGGDQHDVISAKYDDGHIVVSEQGTGSSKLVIEAKREGKEPLIHNLPVIVNTPERIAEMDTTTGILYLVKGFGTRTLDPGTYAEGQLNEASLSVRVVNEESGFQLAFVVFAVMAVAMFLYSFRTTRERVSPPREQKTNLKNDVRDLLNNIPWIYLFFIGIFTLSFVSIRNGAIMYYFKYYIKDEVLASSFMMAGTLANIGGILITQWLAAHLGKKQTYIWSMGLTSLFSVLLYFAGPGDLVMMFGLQILVNFTNGPTAPIVFAMYTDCADYSEWKNGRRATGLVMSASTMAQKFGWTIGGALAGWLLAAYGFKANVVQTTDTIDGIRLMISFIPAIGSVLAGVFMFFYTLDDRHMKQIESDLAARRGTH